MKTVGIIDVGIGNLKSLSNIFELLNYQILYVRKKKDFKLVDILIIPGVGNFKELNIQLIKENLIKDLNYWIKLDKPTIGICLGGQYLFNYSEEAIDVKGLSFFKGNVKKFSESFCNTGWQTVTFKDFNFKNCKFYFNHSYYFNIRSKKKIFGIADIDNFKKIPVLVKDSNICAVQFHPEKSKNNGKNFLKKVLDQWV